MDTSHIASEPRRPSASAWLVLLTLIAATALAVAARQADASRAAHCPPVATIIHTLTASPGVPIDGVVAEVNCLPLGETLSSVTIDWGDGQTSSGTATYAPEAGGTSQTALIHGSHAYAEPGCVAGRPPMPCPYSYPVHTTVVTASDSEHLPGGGYVVAVIAPTPTPRDPTEPAVAPRGNCGLALTAHAERSHRVAVSLRAKHNIHVILDGVIRNGHGRQIGSIHKRVRLHHGHARVTLRVPASAHRAKLVVSYRGSKTYAPASATAVVRLNRQDTARSH